MDIWARREEGEAVKRQSSPIAALLPTYLHTYLPFVLDIRAFAVHGNKQLARIRARLGFMFMHKEWIACARSVR